jgi:hypothetical protein
MWPCMLPISLQAPKTCPEELLLKSGFKLKRCQSARAFPERKSTVEVANKRAGLSTHTSVARQLSALESAIHAAVAAQQAQFDHLAAGLADLTQRKASDLPAIQQATAELRALFEQETGRALAQVRQRVENSTARRGADEQQEQEAGARAQAGLAEAVQAAGGTLKELQEALEVQHQQVTAMVQQQRQVRGQGKVVAIRVGRKCLSFDGPEYTLGT